MIENKPVNAFILGAGFSKAVSTHMPLSQEVSVALRDYVAGNDPDLFSRIPIDLWEDVEFMFGALSEELPWRTEHDNLEKRSIYLRMTELFRQAIAANQRNAFSDLELANEEFWARKLVRGALKRNVGVISLNYDVIFEKLLQIEAKEPKNYQSYYPIPIPNAVTRDGTGLWGGVIPRTTLFLYKLHGSLNWYYTGDQTSAVDQIFDCGLDYVNRTPTSVLTGGERSIFRNLADKVPFIVPPVLSKQRLFTNATVRSIWRSSFAYIRGADNIFIIGYSFPENDALLRYYMREGVRDRKTRVVVVNPDLEVGLRVEALVKKANPNLEFIAYSGSDCIAQFMANIANFWGTE